MHTAGLSVGTSFAAPALTGTVHGTFAPLPIRNLFFQVGMDAGLIYTGDYTVESYYSLTPFAQIGWFYPFEKKAAVMQELVAAI